MDEGGFFTLHIPRLSVGGADEYIAVPYDTVYRAIDALRTRVAEWDPELSYHPDHEPASSSTAWAAASARALAGLISAMVHHGREGGMRELVEQISEFLSKPHARAYLEGLHEGLQREKALESLEGRAGLSQIRAAESGLIVSHITDALDILDALITLYDRRANERPAT